ncbi:MAG TPA: prepilin-type N-terminal cleavage/methylation domain-containing protein [Gemmatimonadales bacterium]|nr:prepilin-type N-terminal cleavage/methylation domain-containing protein [Gemmatimonadales bacterium]
MRTRRGVTLVEMLIAITVFTMVLAATLGFLSRITRGLDRNASDMGMLQNLTFASSILQEELRMAGANVPFKQPVIIYAGANSFSFNADYASNVDSLYAVYLLPNLPAGQRNAMIPADRIAIPGSSPSFSYPDSTYMADGGAAMPSPAETITWFFALDTSTTAGNDYVLFRQVNDQPPEVAIRNVIQTPGRNFFRYYYKRIPASGTSSSSLDTVPTAWMPLRHTQGVHGMPSDTAAAARVDSLAQVEVAFTVTNALTGANQRTRAISFIVPMPNMGTKKVTSCGDMPLFGSGITTTWQINTAASPPDTFMLIRWNRATDETGGESDVVAYIIWRRLLSETTWDEPLAAVPAGAANPSFADQTANPGTQYTYAVAAQDCTPTLSTMSTASPPASP